MQREHPQVGRRSSQAQKFRRSSLGVFRGLFTRGILLSFPRRTALPISQTARQGLAVPRPFWFPTAAWPQLSLGIFLQKKQTKPQKSPFFFPKISTWWCDADDKENKYSWKPLLFHNVVESRENRLFREKIPFLPDMPGPTAAAEGEERRWSRRRIRQRLQITPKGAERHQ